MTMKTNVKFECKLCIGIGGGVAVLELVETVQPGWQIKPGAVLDLVQEDILMDSPETWLDHACNEIPPHGIYQMRGEALFTEDESIYTNISVTAESGILISTCGK